jgi:predicted AAA+ superfamily ATPase
MEEISWDARLIGIKGARGVGKTTLMLQNIKKYLRIDHSVLYVSLDQIWFSENRLTELVDFFVKQGGKHLFLDEVHKYPEWSRELKNIYDDHPGLQIVFTGSSLLEILNARADLSRRAIVYTMQGLSFREYLALTTGVKLTPYSIEQILDRHVEISSTVLEQIKPLEHFSDYLKNGYFPYFMEIPKLYHTRVEEVVNLILEIELPLLRGIDIAYTSKIKQLLLVIAESAPFVPNISKLSERIGINRVTLLSYLSYLQEAGIIRNMYKQARGISRFQKPDKIFLENPNLAFTLNSKAANTGTVRETFFANQLSLRHTLTYPESHDFVVDEKWIFEIGGKGKNSTIDSPESDKSLWFALDGIEYGNRNRIPLWMFGLLY